MSGEKTGLSANEREALLASVRHDISLSAWGVDNGIDMTGAPSGFLSTVERILAARLAASRDAEQAVERVRALVDEWANTDWNATPHLGCLDMRRYCADRLRAALNPAPEEF